MALSTFNQLQFLTAAHLNLHRGGSRGRVQGVRTPPRDDLRFSNTTKILQKNINYEGFIGLEVEQETSAPPPNKKPGSAPVAYQVCTRTF